MSLLNEMLVDLEQRNEIGELPDNTGLQAVEADNDKSHSARYFIIALFLLITAVCLAYFYTLKTSINHAEAPLLPFATNEESVKVEVGTRKEPMLFSQNNKSSSVVESSETEIQFTSDDENKPSENLQIPVGMSPHNSEEKGIEEKQSAETVNEIAESKVQNPTESETLATRDLEKQLADLPASAAGLKNEQLAQARPTFANKSVKPSREVEKQDTPGLNQGEQALHIALSPETLDRQEANKARTLRQKLSDNEAEKVLLNQIEQWPGSVISMQMLADLYFDKARRLELGLLVAEKKFSDASLRAYVLARLYTLDGQDNLALELLEKPYQQNKVHGGIENAYLALMAALYQQKSAYAEAETLFRHLLKKNPEDVRNWLGLALASDAQHKNAQALQAFKTVENLGAPSERVTQYIQQRITQLAGASANRRQGS